jgi:CRP-like cAMP-binding protein
LTKLINFLFDDIFQQFRNFFFKKKHYNSPFYYEIAFVILPRFYGPDTVLFNRGDEFHEILMLVEGEIKVVVESSDGDIPPLERYFQKGFFFGDYNILSDNNSSFKYVTVSTVKLLAIPKYKFLRIVKKYEEIRKEMKERASDFSKVQSGRFERMFQKQMKEKFPAMDETELKARFRQAINSNFGKESFKKGKAEANDHKPKIYSTKVLNRPNLRN